MALSTEKIIVLDSVGSTNNYAMGLIQQGQATHGSSVFALEQISGKGRMGRTWNSGKGDNILLSVVTDMKWAFMQSQFLLSMVAALSVCELLEKNAPVKAFVKWPNDIYINDKKAAGILIENVVKGTLWQWAITGFGININQTDFKEELNATSLSLATHKNFDVLQLASDLKDTFLLKITEYQAGNEAAIVKAYNEKLHKRGETVKIQTNNRVFETRIKGVTKAGKLLTSDAFENEWDLDKVKIRY